MPPCVTSDPLVKGFFGSGHVDTQQMIDIYEETGRYDVSLHQFVRAVIYGDAEHYDPEQSPIANLFDVSRLDPREHFLLPLMLGQLVSTSPGNDEGFVETAVIYERLQGFGFTPEQIDVAVIRAHRKN